MVPVRLVMTGIALFRPGMRPAPGGQPIRS